MSTLSIIDKSGKKLYTKSRKLINAKKKVNSTEERISDLFDINKINIKLDLTNDSTSHENFYTYFNNTYNILTIFKCNYNTATNSFDIKIYNNKQYNFGINQTNNNVYLYNTIKQSHSNEDKIDTSDLLLFTDTNKQNFIIANNELVDFLTKTHPSFSIVEEKMGDTFRVYDDYGTRRGFFN